MTTSTAILTESEKRALRIAAVVARAVYQTVAETQGEGSEGLGVPSSPVYLAMAEHGCTLNQFEAIVGALEMAGAIKRTGLHTLRADRVRGRELGLES